VNYEEVALAALVARHCSAYEFSPSDSTQSQSHSMQLHQQYHTLLDADLICAVQLVDSTDKIKCVQRRYADYRSYVQCVRRSGTASI
jgi:hypothetical protein